MCREAGRMDEAVQCYSICIQLQFRAPTNPLVARAVAANPQAAAAQQAQRLSVAYNNLGGILKLQVCMILECDLGCRYEVLQEQSSWCQIIVTKTMP